MRARARACVRVCVRAYELICLPYIVCALRYWNDDEEEEDADDEDAMISSPITRDC